MGGKHKICGNKRKMTQSGITLIALVITIIVMLILSGVSINAIVGDDGIISKAQNSTYWQSIAVLQEYFNMEYSNYTLDDNPYITPYGLLRAKHPGWFYQNAQGYILDAEGHVLYLIKKEGLPDEIKSQIKGGNASKVSQYYKQQDVYGVTSDLQVYYCKNGTSNMMGLTTEDLDKDNPLEIAYDEDSLLAQVVNGVGDDGKALSPLSAQALKGIKTLTIDTTEKLKLLDNIKELILLETVYFKDIQIPNLNGIQFGTTIREVRFTNCEVADYSALGGLVNLNKLYLIAPAGKNTDIVNLCDATKGIKNAAFTNLQYFGITGTTNGIQSTAQSGTTTRFDVTDISPLAQLDNLKSQVQYLYLQNLQLTNIEAISGFTKVAVFRCEYNALTTLNGIQNMERLARLFANNNLLGNSETDTQEPTTDALSYIYNVAPIDKTSGNILRDEDGNFQYGTNNVLVYADLRNNDNLKWTAYLSKCTAISGLYLTNNANIKDIENIKTTIGNCGTNYVIPAAMTKDIIAKNSKKLDLNNTTIKVDKFEELIDNTSLTHLNMQNVKIQEKDSSNFLTGSELNKKINDVLKTCTNLTYLRIAGVSDLSTIEFVKSTPKLKELDIRNTKVKTGTTDDLGNNTGLELLNDLVKHDTSGKKTAGLGCLLVTGDSTMTGNQGIDFTKIQPTVSELTEYSGWEGLQGGLYCSNWEALKTLEQCTEIKNLVCNWHNICPFSYDSRKVLDLTACTNLTYYDSVRFNNEIILPSSMIRVTCAYNAGALPNVSNCTNMTYLQLNEDFTCPSQTMYTKLLRELANCSSLESLNIQRCPIRDLTEIGNSLRTMTSIKNIWVGSAYAYSGYPGFHVCTDFSPLASGTSIENLYMIHQNGITDISFINQMPNLKLVQGTNLSLTSVPDMSNLVNLTTLNLGNNKIVDISKISTAPSLTNVSLNGNQITDITSIGALTNLKSINLDNNRVSDVKSLEGLRNLETVNLSNNALFDSAYDSAGNAYYTLTVFADMNQKQGGSLKNLYLSGNNIEDFSMLQDSNLKWDAKSGW